MATDFSPSTTCGTTETFASSSTAKPCFRSELALRRVMDGAGRKKWCVEKDFMDYRDFVCWNADVVIVKVS